MVGASRFGTRFISKQVLILGTLAVLSHDSSAKVPKQKPADVNQASQLQQGDNQVFSTEGDGDFPQVVQDVAEAELEKKNIISPKENQNLQSRAIEPKAKNTRLNANTNSKTGQRAVSSDSQDYQDITQPTVGSHAVEIAQADDVAGEIPKDTPATAESLPMAPVVESTGSTIDTTTSETASPAEAPGVNSVNEDRSSPKAKKAKKSVKGYMAKTKRECPMYRKASASSEEVSKTKAGKKIYVEPHNGEFLKVYNRAGEGVFVKKSCVAK
jgi:hypothetical protein